MKTITNFINESLSGKQKEIIGEIFSKLFKGSSLSKDQIIILLNNIDDKEIIYCISRYFSENDTTNYLAYEPSDDLFINYESNKKKIIEQLAEFIYKYKIMK